MPLTKLSVGAGANAPDNPPDSPVDTQYQASLKHNANIDYLIERIAFFEARVKMRFNTLYAGVPGADQLFSYFRVQEAFTLPANLAGCFVEAGTGATATYTISIMRDASVVATATFASGGQAGMQTATLATTGGTTQAFASGTLFRIVGQSTPDATLNGPSLYIVAPWNPLP